MPPGFPFEEALQLFGIRLPGRARRRAAWLSRDRAAPPDLLHRLKSRIGRVRPAWRQQHIDIASLNDDRRSLRCCSTHGERHMFRAVTLTTPFRSRNRRSQVRPGLENTERSLGLRIGNSAGRHPLPLVLGRLVSGRGSVIPDHAPFLFPALGVRAKRALARLVVNHNQLARRSRRLALRSKNSA
jgi:hypothetical protein